MFFYQKFLIFHLLQYFYFIFFLNSLINLFVDQRAVSTPSSLLMQPKIKTLIFFLFLLLLLLYYGRLFLFNLLYYISTRLLFSSFHFFFFSYLFFSFSHFLSFSSPPSLSSQIILLDGSCSFHTNLKFVKKSIK